jgi:nitroreductase
MSEPRQAEHSIESFLLERWSPRSFLPEAISDEELLSLFEAAKWAPSSYNNQPWRFLYAKRGSASWPLFFDALISINQSWVQHASALVLVISSTNFDHNGKPSRTHSFDAGAASENLALQAWLKGYAAHAMEGFDYDKARQALAIPADFHVEAMIALGKQGPKETLPAPLQEREAPSARRPLAETILEGKFGPSLIHSEKK